MSETTATADPFAGGATATDDPFNQPTGGGNFPKLEDLEGYLLMIEPKAITPVVDKFHKPKDGETQRMKDRVTCNVVVFQADGSRQTFRGMYISQAGLVPQLQQILTDANPNRPFVLGVLGMLPNKQSKLDGIDTREKLKAAIEKWVRSSGKGNKPGYFWGLDQFTDAQANMARPVALAMINKSNPFA